jgi:hypothetical protein
MAIAKVQSLIIKDAKELSRKGTTRELAANARLSKSRVGVAFIILEYAKDLSDAVILGGVTLDKAHKIAQHRKKEAESEKGKMERLRKDAQI